MGVPKNVGRQLLGNLRVQMSPSLLVNASECSYFDHLLYPNTRNLIHKMPSGPVLEIEVTEDARASVQKNCERCRTVIKVGERCHEVINRQKGTQRECCGDCFDHYAGKLNTTVRT